jgi:hypothetical protein
VRRFHLENGFDNVAPLGTIWNSENPIKTLNHVRKNRPFVLA